MPNEGVPEDIHNLYSRQKRYARWFCVANISAGAVIIL